VKGPGACLEPGGVADSCLYRPSQAFLSDAESSIELISVRFTQDKDVNIPDRPVACLPFVSGGPGAVDVCLSDPVYSAQDFGHNGGYAKGPGQDFCQPSVIRAGGVSADEPGIPDLARGDQTCLLSALNLAVNRRMGGADLGRDLGKAELKVRIA